MQRVNPSILHYEIEGEGPILALICGYRADISSWLSVRSSLARHFQLILIDNPGAGLSPCPEKHLSIDVMAEKIIQLFQHLGIKEAFVLGHSMGGAIAQTLGYRHPTVVKALILSNTLIKIRAGPAFTLNYLYTLRKKTAFMHAAEGSLPWLLSDRFLQEPRLVANFLKYIEKNPKRQSIEGQRKQLEAVLAFDSKLWFHKIEAPTLVIGGDDDILCPKDSKLLGEGIPRAQLVIMKDQAHLPQVENPRKFLRIVINFLNKHS